jgi:hypothetical protein
LNRNPRTLVAIAASQIDTERKQWIEVIPTATKARNGPWFFTITEPDLETYATSIRKSGGKIPVDYDHDGAMDGGSTRAAGWFTGQAEVRDTDNGPRLLADVQWTPAAAKQIEDGEFRFISPEFDFANRDEKTGLLTKAKDIIAATLTNRPFFRQLAPVGTELVESTTLDAIGDRFGHEAAQLVLDAMASEDPALKASAQALITTIEAQHEGDDMDTKAIATALGLAEDATAEQILEAANKAAAAAKTTPEPKPEPVKAKHDPKLLEVFGLADDATPEQILAAANDMKTTLETTTGMSRDALDKLTATVTRGVETDRELAELQEEKRKASHNEERERILAKAVEERRILPVHKESLRELYDIDPDRVKAVIAAAPKGSFRETGHGGEGPNARPAPRAIQDRRGNVVVAVEDPEWLDKRAQEILRAAGKTMNKVSADEYAEALEQATAEASPVAG